jgi:hypothetical protein
VFDITHLSKAKRRLGNDKGFLICFETFSPIGEVQPVAYAIDVRFLIKE